MDKKRTIPPHSKMFLYRQGLKVLPSQNFIDKFIENYNELLFHSKSRQHLPPIDEKQAIFFINSVIESFIYCLDFGFTIKFKHCWLLSSRLSDYEVKAEGGGKKISQNVKKINLTPFMRIKHKIKKLINQDNKEYQEFLTQKKERHNDIKRYYRNLYDKKGEWWTSLSD